MITDRFCITLFAGKRIFMFLFLFLMAVNLSAQPVWTFDCSEQGWGTRSHVNNFDVTYLAPGQGNPSGRIAFRHTGSNYENWLFAPVKNRINADLYKHVYFSLELNDAGTIPVAGINALFVWISDSVAGTLRTKTFRIVSGSQVCHLDLSADPNWKGVVEISRFHFPSGDQRPQGYIPDKARYFMDWLVCTSSALLQTPEQDTNLKCKPYSKPVLSGNVETAVFGTSVSLKSSQLTGGLCQLELAYRRSTDSVRVWNYGTVSDGPVYASLSFLKPETGYSYLLKVTNMFGSDSLSGIFTTGPEENYNLRGKNELWFTPSPFAPDLNGLFTDNGSPWQLEKVKNRGFHVREDQILPTVSNFSQVNVREMIFQLTKRKLHLSMEASGLVPGDANTVQSVSDASVKKALQVLDKIYSQGGKLDYLSPDCIIKRVTGILPNSTANLSMEQAFDAAALYFTGIHKKYPNIKIGYLVNFPNWHFEFRGIMHYGTAGGSYTKKSGYTFDKVLSEISGRLKPFGEKISFVEVDNPYKPYYLSTSIASLPGITLDNPAMLTALEQYCHENGMDYGLIFNSASGGGISNKAYYDESLLFFDDYLAGHGIPDFLTVESWYKYPDKTLPASDPYSFMYLLRDFEFKLAGKIPSTGIVKTKLPEINVFPNPSQGCFFISGSGDTEVRVKIFTVNGTLAFSGCVNGQGPVNPALGDGVYVVVLETGNRNTVRKLVIRNR